MANKQRFQAFLAGVIFCSCSAAPPSGAGQAAADVSATDDAALADAAADAAPDAVTDAAAVADAVPDAAADAVPDAAPDSGADAATDAVADAAPEVATDVPAADVPPGDATANLADPNAAGPYTFAEFDDKATIGATGDAVAVHCAYPTGGPSAGPYPVIVVAHGFQLTPDKYYGYVQRLASFGYVAVTVDFPTSLFGNDNVAESKDLAGALDWAAGKGGVLAGKVDVNNAGIVGHSLGGKLAYLTATQDPRFKAVFGLDPVDGGGPMGCNPPQCVNVAAKVGALTIPTGFVGETTDSGNSMQPCAPAANNFQTFYAAVPAPSFAVTVVGANHMSFLDNTSNCLSCGFCNAATLSQDVVVALARAYVTAFFERNLRGLTGYDAYLTGAIAQSRYVATKIATIQNK